MCNWCVLRYTCSCDCDITVKGNCDRCGHSFGSDDDEEAGF